MRIICWMDVLQREFDIAGCSDGGDRVDLVELLLCLLNGQIHQRPGFG
jgi:hypothetical protein